MFPSTVNNGDQRATSVIPRSIDPHRSAPRQPRTTGARTPSPPYMRRSHQADQSISTPYLQEVSLCLYLK